ncbi:MAG: radical SAM family heme chaperone HemW [Fibrobacterota bacterium]
MPLGIYIHVPFCARKCGYCDFYSVEKLDKMAPFLSALDREVLSTFTEEAAPVPADTLYVGGGTPSLVPAGALEQLLTLLQTRVQFKEGAEITLECNPGSPVVERAAAWRAMGFNRISVGAQSFRETDLHFLNRIHTAEQTEASVQALRDAGFGNINLDLIFSLPGQTASAFQDNLRRALALNVEHLSVYGLSVEPGTPLAHRQEKGEFTRVNDETYEAHFLTAHGTLTSNGYHHYEISNYARPGFESRHNWNYWHEGDYVGLGASAHSKIGNRRWANVMGLDTYVKDPMKKAFTETLSDKERRMERIMLQLRTSAGIDKGECGGRRTVDRLLRKGWLVETPDRLVLTAEGMLLIDEITLLLEGDACLTSN